MAKWAQMKDGVCINVIEWDPKDAVTWPEGVTVVAYDIAHEALRPVPPPAPPAELPPDVAALIEAKVKERVAEELKATEALPEPPIE
jgi:hypothetical protein